MAQKKQEKFSSKNVKVNSEELSITKIGEITTTEQSSIFVLILFGCVLVFIFFLPTIVNWIKGSDDKPDYSILENNKNLNETEKPDTPSQGTVEEYYNFSDTLSISLETGITISNFVINANGISFTVTNTNETRFYFNKDNYFLELYTEDNTLLERIILSDVVVASKNNMVLEFAISDTSRNSMKKLLFVKKDRVMYPDILLEKNENQEEFLTCIKGGETITYTFKDLKLNRITEAINYDVTNPNYSVLLEQWKTDSEKLNSVEGITSIFVNTGNGFLVNTVIDLKNVKNSNVESVHYYPNETLAKVVKFEMEARGFQCK